ncbi:MAG: YicC/YloC family endoribonuclease [Planctomycetota bacterium]
MILSMTGFGEADGLADGVHYRVELRSFNNRYFKSSIKLPEVLQPAEVEIEKLLRSRLGRGSVSYSLRMKDENPSAAHEINIAVLTRYVRQLREAAGDTAGLTIDLANLIDIPGVAQPPAYDAELLSSRFTVVERLTNEAIDRLIEMRRAEGAALLRDLQKHCDVIRTRLADIRQRSPLVVKEYQKKYHARVQQLIEGSKIEIDHDSVVRELAIFAERCDINEEVSRIDSHLDQFAELCDAPEESGRKLDFLAQEMLREANTIGSKANDAEISRHVVETKAAIDRIKEQVQNVE